MPKQEEGDESVPMQATYVGDTSAPFQPIYEPTDKGQHAYRHCTKFLFICPVVTICCLVFFCICGIVLIVVGATAVHGDVSALCSTSNPNTTCCDTDFTHTNNCPNFGTSGCNECMCTNSITQTSECQDYNSIFTSGIILLVFGPLCIVFTMICCICTIIGCIIAIVFNVIGYVPWG